MVTVSIRLDEKLKSELDEMCGEMGMNLTTFFMLYAKKAARDRRIPFEIAAPRDPFYGDANQKRLRESARQIHDGKTVTKTMAELEAMEDA
ncbi:MAG: type II toxin-antitoxin system RelB/DinJ family antitoxin [Bacillota bacterium]